jgi:hypothetical protein
MCAGLRKVLTSAPSTSLICISLGRDLTAVIIKDVPEQATLLQYGRRAGPSHQVQIVQLALFRRTLPSR